MPWQAHVADVLLEQNDDGSLVYSEAGLVVGRQEGKTELKFVLAVMRLTAMVATHGPQRATYTMQTRARARTRLERDYAPRLRNAKGFVCIDPKSRQRPAKQAQWRLGMNSGVEHIQFGPESYLQIDTPSRDGGHGDTLDLGMIDEAFAHQDDTVELGMEPAMLTRRDAQLLVLSAAGDANSKYLYRKILRGRSLVEAGADIGVAYFEWSAADDADPADPRVWRDACPALGFTVTEEKLARLWAKANAPDAGEDAVAQFQRSYLCQWPEVPVLEDDSAKRWLSMQETDWNACRSGGPIPKPSGWSIDVDRNEKGQMWSAIGCSDGDAVDIAEQGEGSMWTVGSMLRLRSDHPTARKVGLSGDGLAGELVKPLKDAGFEVTDFSGKRAAQATGLFLTSVKGRLLRVPEQVDRTDTRYQDRWNALTAAASRAVTRSVGDGPVTWDHDESPGDISPLVAVTWAKAMAKKQQGNGFFI